MEPNTITDMQNGVHVQTVNMHEYVRSMLDVRAASFDAETLTVECVFATSTPVLRYGWDGPFMEVLEISPSAMRMDRLAGGKCPVLNSHNSCELSDTIGIVEAATIRNGEAVATLRFSKREDVAPIVQDIADGILRNISVGYRVHRLEQTLGGDSEVPVYTATDWEPYEISVVPIPADAGAGIRAEAVNKTNICTVTRAAAPVNKGNDEMEPTQTPAADNPAGGAPVVSVEAARAAAASAERARVTEIRSIAKAAKLEDAELDKYIAEGTSADEVRKVAIDKLAAAADATPTHSHVRVLSEAGDTRAADIESALLHRFAPAKHKLEGNARNYRSMSLLEITRECLEARGINTKGMSKMELAGRGLHSTSDFPIILANIANKTLRSAYELAPATFEPLVRRTTASDFKPITRAQLGEAPQLTKITENGEFTRGTIGENKEVYQLATYGKVIGITRQVIINDDLDALTRIPGAFGQQAAQLVSDLVWGVILNNANMNDGNALFHANHKNLNTGTGSALSASDLTSLNTARKGLRVQKGLDGKSRLNLAATHLIVPPELEMVAQQLTSMAMQATKAGDVNVFNTLTPIVESRLSDLATYGATAWYLAATGQTDIIELAFLDGEQGPVFDTRQGFDVDGVEFKVRMDVAAAAIDYRGLQRSNGA